METHCSAPELADAGSMRERWRFAERVTVNDRVPALSTTGVSAGFLEGFAPDFDEL